MKRIICIVMTIILIFLFCCGCNEKETEPGTYGSFVLIEQINEPREDYLVYHKDTKVVYEVNSLDYHKQIFIPYQVYKNGVIYGAVYEDGEIKLVPYAMGLTDEMIKEYLNKLLFEK